MFSNRQIQAGYSVQFDLEKDYESSSSLHADLLTRADLLLADLTAFQSYLQSQKKENAVDIRQFRSSVESEVHSLERIAYANSKWCLGTEDRMIESETKRLHALQSSNIPFYEVVWAAARKCDGVVALGKRIRHKRSTKDENASAKCYGGPLKGFIFDTKAKNVDDEQEVDSVIVDIVADDGKTWIKVSTKSDKRLLFEMAKEGWEVYDGDSGENDADSDVPSDSSSAPSHHASGGLELVRLAENMKKAASTVRVRFCHPRIHFILPRISEGRLTELDGVIGDIRKTGVTVECGSDPEESTKVPDSHIPLSAYSDAAMRFSRMLPQARPALTSILNIDCTILLALISDISHFRSEHLPTAPNDHYHSAITRQIQSEATAALLRTELFPILVGRQMQCTWQATRRMREIVQTMGTSSENARADILLGEGTYAGMSEVELRGKLEFFSDHAIPAGLHLPLTVVNFDVGHMLADNTFALATRLLSEIAKGLSEINKSVYLYGWSQNIVTISSNRKLAKDVERTVCQLLDETEREKGEDSSSTAWPIPDIWVCGVARSLIGKEKGRKDALTAGRL